MTHPYSTLAYATSLAKRDQIVQCEMLGIPLRLRSIPNSDLVDAVGAYPVAPTLAMPSRANLLAELTQMGAVSLVMVSDPLAPTPPPPVFDVLRPYKLHHVVERNSKPVVYSKHHRAEVRRAQRKCQTRQIDLARLALTLRAPHLCTVMFRIDHRFRIALDHMVQFVGPQNIKHRRRWGWCQRVADHHQTDRAHLRQLSK